MILQDTFYNTINGGFFGYRLKTINRSKESKKGEATAVSSATKENAGIHLTKEVSQDKLKILKQVDPKKEQDVFCDTMKSTLFYRREKVEEIFSLCPRFLDTPNLVIIFLAGLKNLLNRILAMASTREYF